MSKVQAEHAYLYIMKVLDDLSRGIYEPGICDQILQLPHSDSFDMRRLSNVGRISSYNLPSRSSSFKFERGDSVKFYIKPESEPDSQFNFKEDNSNLITLVEDQLDTRSQLLCLKMEVNRF